VRRAALAERVRSRRVAEMYERQRHLFQLTVALDERIYREQLSKRFAHQSLQMCRPRTFNYIHNIISVCSVWHGVGPEIVARGRSLVAGILNLNLPNLTDRWIRKHSRIIGLGPQ